MSHRRQALLLWLETIWVVELSLYTWLQSVVMYGAVGVYCTMPELSPWPTKSPLKDRQLLTQRDLHCWPSFRD